MQIKINGSKDVTAIEVYESTNIAALALWEANNFGWIENEEIFNKEFEKIYTEGQDKFVDKALVLGTGSDGNFKVKILVNLPLSDGDTKNIYKSVKGIKMVTDGKWCIGSPEEIGYRETEAVEKNMVDTLEITPGIYLFDVYSLLIKDSETGKAKYLEFVYVITPESKYQSSERNESSKILSLKYTQSQE